ncbi:MAG: DSD1 family PLP-dependent enzyme [Acidobacteria bacterium]|nr:DSD1 family PLP-dependent enzyme [Acidobacteriota bacterium]
MQPSHLNPPIGSTIEDIDTPCLLLDLDIFEANVRQISDYCSSHGLAWRPHAKSHKCPDIAHKIISAGAIGLTCAKLGEAEVMAEAGIRDLLIANPLASPIKVRRLAALREVADPIVLVDHADHVGILAASLPPSRPVRVLIEIDIGMNRCGVQPGGPAVTLAQLIAATPALEFAGIMGYEGHLLMVEDPTEKQQRIAASIGLLAETKLALDESGIPCPIVSAGGTGSFEITALQPGLTELQAGGGIFMDLLYRELCHVDCLDYALTILAAVTSRPAADRAIIDAGRKTMNQEMHIPEIKGRDDLRIKGLSAEHGVLEVTSGPGPRIGEKIQIIPGYGDFTTVLHDRFYCLRNGRLEAIWPLTARGRLD